MSRMMPFSLEAEQSVLGAAFLNPKVLIAIIDKLVDEGFF